MTGCNCTLDGTVTIDASGTALSRSFTDGTHTLTLTHYSLSLDA
jgi:hypothetical protein